MNLTMQEKLEAAKAWLAANPPRNPVVVGRHAAPETRIPARHPAGQLKAWEVRR